MPPDSMKRIRKGAFDAVQAATGTPPSLFSDSDGTSQRESFSSFDGCSSHDLVGRASAFQKLVTSGLPIQEALVPSGLLAADE